MKHKIACCLLKVFHQKTTFSSCSKKIISALPDEDYWPQTDDIAQHKKALANLRKILPAVHPDIAMALYVIGVVHHRKGLYDEAMGYYQESLEMRRECLPAVHPDTARTLHDIGVVQTSQSKLVEALAASAAHGFVCTAGDSVR